MSFDIDPQTEVDPIQEAYDKGFKAGILDCGHRLLRILSRNLIYPNDMPLYSPLLNMDVVCMAVEQIYREEKLIEEKK